MTDSTEKPPGQGPEAQGSGLITSIQDIMDFDAKLWEITRGLPIRTGSILKVPASFYSRFGIEITPDNRARLKEMSENFYAQDIEERLKRERLRQGTGLPEIKFRSETGNKMSWLVAEIVREMMRTIDDGTRRFRICDIGCRKGETASAIAGELYRHHEVRDMLGRVELHLVDWSPIGLFNARQNIKDLYGIEVHKHEYIDFEQFLRGREDGSFDFIVSVAGFERKAFPDYMQEIRRVLADSGALVSGGWHSAQWHHPYNLYRLLQAMGTEEARLGALTRLFAKLLSPTQDWNPFPEESQALKDHFDYWLKVHEEVKSQGILGRPRVYMLRANKTSREHMQDLASAGFTTSMDDIRRAFKGATLPAELPKRILSGTDFAAVTAAIKK